MAIYDTRYGLTQPIVNYLNQALPNISNIFGTGTGITSITPTATAAPVAGLTPEQLALLYPQVQTGGGDGPRGGGIFGNLDMSRPKEFLVNGEIVIGYPNLSSGLYQDEKGRNIQNLGIKNLPGIGSILDKLLGERKPPTYPGLFDKVSPSALFKNPYLAKSFFDRQDVAKQKRIQDEVEAANRAAAESITIRRAKENRPDVYRKAEKENRLGPGGGFSTTGSKPGTSLGSGQFSSKSSRGRQDY